MLRKCAPGPACRTETPGLRAPLFESHGCLSMVHQGYHVTSATRSVPHLSLGAKPVLCLKPTDTNTKEHQPWAHAASKQASSPETYTKETLFPPQLPRQLQRCAAPASALGDLSGRPPSGGGQAPLTRRVRSKRTQMP